jgi:acetyltransferase-like isoleucine patch superfamily enzyme
MPAARDWDRRLWALRWRTGPRLASDARILLARVTHRHCVVRIPRSAYAGPGFRLEIPEAGTLVVGRGVSFRRGFYCEIAGSGTVTIGAGTQFAGPTTIQCSTSITIGARCLFAASVLLADGAHRFRDPTREIWDQGYAYRSVSIGDGALVHAHATIVADVGRHSVIGANSLVNKDVPDYALAGGVPARVLETFTPSASGRGAAEHG